MPAPILFVAGLLADEHERRARRPLAEDGLGRREVERARVAAPTRQRGVGERRDTFVSERAHRRWLVQARGRLAPRVHPVSGVRRGRVFVGPSGWTYPSWRAQLGGGDRLGRLATMFNAVEVNGSHYTQIRRERYAAWAAETPPAFRFAVKGHRFVTHWKRLSDCGDSVRRLREQASGLGEKLAAVVWQLPATFRRDLPRLDDFLGVLGAWPEVRHALELRHASWFTEDVRARLAAARVANCLSDAPDFPMWQEITTDFVYVRLHGHTRKYASSYARATLARWATRARAWARAGRDVHVYLDNDAEGAALTNGQTLVRLLGPLATPPGA